MALKRMFLRLQLNKLKKKKRKAIVALKKKIRRRKEKPIELPEFKFKYSNRKLKFSANH